MSRRRGHSKRKSRKKLAYGVIAVIFILICFATAYYYLNPPNQKSSDQISPDQTRKAAIVDQLSFKNETANQTFVDISKNILKNAGFAVDYYGGNEVNITFYKHLFTHGDSLIVFRVHSAMIEDLDSLGLFTSEPLDESKFNTSSAPYYDDVVNNRIVKAYFPEDPTQYFAIAPGFVEKYGNFQDATIIMMGCDGLKNNKTAQAFINKGAKVCIGWDGLVSTPHTDHATTRLLQHLAQGNTIEKAVNETMNEVGPEEMYFENQGGYNSTLTYYPKAAGSYTIRYSLAISSMDTVRANTVLVKEEKKGTRSSAGIPFK